MNRHYYISDNLDDLEEIERQLEAGGIATEQIHVLSEQDAALERHHVHSVPSLLKTDVVNAGRRGMLIGLALAVLVLLTAYLLGWTDSPAGWVPFIFLALILFGFSTWEGGLFGIQNPNPYFRRLQDTLRAGRHVFFVDVEPPQERILERVIEQHPHLQSAGIGQARPYWVMAGQQGWNRFRKML